ncbi:helix-turn-helix domain-containing protein [uncultured Megasphaera sp.]|uniref:helix-turn-helix domain-containing protein n=1 Tax=uncultured Megasphaera sp. TaxID=165188 RepID=UPI00266C2BA8|nr:helix-turn-helix transcriptional regulator [uncultured Megasphaera sp.]MBS5582787.1 helix-turn-helix transcriptional regulator [Megasphaera sp.]
MMKIGEWVRQYRKEHGLSMQAFGDLCGLSRAYISILEKGINPTTNKPFSPTIQTVQKIADVTGLDLNLLDKDQSLIINSKSTDDNQNISDADRKLLELYHSLDAEDRAEIRGEIKGMLKAAKYKSKVKSDEAI